MTNFIDATKQTICCKEIITQLKVSRPFRTNLERNSTEGYEVGLTHIIRHLYLHASWAEISATEIDLKKLQPTTSYFQRSCFHWCNFSNCKTKQNFRNCPQLPTQGNEITVYIQLSVFRWTHTDQNYFQWAMVGPSREKHSRQKTTCLLPYYICILSTRIKHVNTYSHKYIYISICIHMYPTSRRSSIDLTSSYDILICSLLRYFVYPCSLCENRFDNSNEMVRKLVFCPKPAFHSW